MRGRVDQGIGDWLRVVMQWYKARPRLVRYTDCLRSIDLLHLHSALKQDPCAVYFCDAMSFSIRLSQLLEHKKRHYDCCAPLTAVFNVTVKSECDITPSWCWTRCRTTTSLRVRSFCCTRSSLPTFSTLVHAVSSASASSPRRASLSRSSEECQAQHHHHWSRSVADGPASVTCATTTEVHSCRAAEPMYP